MFPHVQAAWARTDLTSPIQQVLLLFLADKANDDGVMWWSVPNIAKACRASEKTVRLALKEMYDLGIIGSESEPQAGAVTHWMVSSDPVFLFRTPVVITRVRKRGRKATPVIVTPDSGNCDRATPVIVTATPVIVTATPVVITDKATKNQPVEATKKTIGVAADAAPTIAGNKTKPPKPEKTDTQKATNGTIRRLRSVFWEHFAPMDGMDAEWMGRNLSKVLGSYPEDDIAGTLRAIAAKYPDAKSKGQTLSFLNLSLWVEEWQDAGRPGVFPGAVVLHLPGGTNGNATSGHLAASKTIADAGRFDPWKDKYGPRGTSHLSLTAHRDAG